MRQLLVGFAVLVVASSLLVLIWGILKSMASCHRKAKPRPDKRRPPDLSA